MEKQCALLPMVREYIEPLMTLMRPILDNEYKLDNKTKCLYTAVLIMSIYIGRNSLDVVKTCDVDHIKELYMKMNKRAKSKNPDTDFDLSTINVRECFEMLTSPTTSGRHLFYIMMSNAEVPKYDDPEGQTILFPGHVCVIEKYPSNRYYVYQSYINKYDINGHFEKNNNSFAISRNDLLYVFNAIAKLYTSGIWTHETTEAYQKLTHINCPEYENRLFKHKSFFCFRLVPIKTCTTRLKSIIKKAIKPSNKKVDDNTKRQLRALLQELGT